jgi:hypothetical protein
MDKEKDFGILTSKTRILSNGVVGGKAGLVMEQDGDTSHFN